MFLKFHIKDGSCVDIANKIYTVNDCATALNTIRAALIATKPEPIEGLREALEYWRREDCIANTIDARIIEQAARRYLDMIGD